MLKTLLKSYYPKVGSDWVDTDRGIFTLTDNFYKNDGGIFDTAEHYKRLVANA